MESPPQFQDVLEQYVRRSGYTAGQLSKLSSVPKMTILNWLEGRVKRPRVRDDLLKLAAVLHLNEAEASALLRVAGHPTIAELLARGGTRQERELLTPWVEAARQPVEQPPFQAIADIPYFVGREHELQELKTALLSGNHVTLYSLHGMGGVGKTALAVRIAYLLRPHFPDGVLWARVDTAEPMSILRAFAHTYGHDVSAYEDLESRSLVVREILANKRALVVLDNVRGSADVEPLLPPTGTCAVLMTTRRHDLAVASGVCRFHIGPFDRERREALDLFEKLLGVERVRQEREALADIADMVGHLPLAIAIVAGRLAYELGWSAVDFAERMRREQQRLDELAYENQSVRLSFNLSYNMLLPAQQRFFATLGIFGGEDVSADTVAYVAELSLDQAQDNLRRLHGLSLVLPGRPGRYRLHPLLRDYAREQIDDDRRFERMVEWFVRFVEQHERDYPLLDLESGNIITALEIAFERGMRELQVRGASALYHFLEIRGLYEWADIHLQRAHQAARSSDDVEGAMTVSLSLGRVAERRGDYARADVYLQEGLALAQRMEDGKSISAFLAELGTVAAHRGDYARAEIYFREGLALAREMGHSERVVHLLTNLGVAARRRGDSTAAEAHWQEGLALARAIGYRESVSLLLTNLGGVAGEHEDYARAETYLQEGLVLAREIGHRERIVVLLTNLGLLLDRRGDFQRGDAYLQEGLALAREIGHRERIGILLSNLGALARQRGDLTRAEAYLREGLELARTIEHLWLIGIFLNEWGEFHLKRQDGDAAAIVFRDALEIARSLDLRAVAADAHYGLAQVAAARQEIDEAWRQGRQSLAAFEAIRHPMATEVAQWMAGLPEHSIGTLET